MMKKLVTLSILLTLLTIRCSFSQVSVLQETNNIEPSTSEEIEKKSDYYHIKGTVISDRSKLPLVGVSVYSSNLLFYTSTDTKGKYTLRVSATASDSIIIHFRLLGYKEYQKVIFGNTENLIIKLREDNLQLSEVVVTASKGNGLGSEGHINNQAIQHVQAVSLSDLMQLLPGHLQENPSLSDPSQIILRQAVKLSSNNTVQYGEKEGMNSLGLKTIVDGMPLSNNSNLQIYNIANTYNLSAGNTFSTVSGRGTDMRQISTENIEEITVISGIPSAKYGDLTTGVVLVETKSGETPYKVELKTDPRLTQFGMNKGFRFKRDGGAFNIHIDFTKSLKSENQEELAYKRINTSLIYSKSFLESKNFVTKTNMSYNSTFDDYHSEVINMKPEEKISSSDANFSLSTRGRWFIKKSWLRKLEYQLGFNRQWQNSDITRYRSESMQAVATSYVDTIMPVDIVPYTYLYNLKIEGIPTRYYAKLNSEFLFTLFKTKNQILTGVEWTTEKNDGEGKIFDINNPPGNSNSTSLRPRKYKNIPSQNTLSLYIEDEISFKLLNRGIIGSFGLRYDNYDPIKNSKLKNSSFLSPRINVLAEIVGGLKIKAGWGKTAKSIPMLYMYPEKAYFDFLNLNYYKSLKNDEKEYFFLNTTRVFDTENVNLKVATANKKELGLSYKHKLFNIDVTFFDEKVNNAYTLTRQPVFLERDNYQLTEYIDKINSKYKYVKTDTLSRSYTYPSNDRKITNKGVEFQANISQIKLINTSFVLNGSYVQTRYQYIAPHIENNSWNSTVFPVFKPGDGSYTDMFVTNLTAVHHMPILRYVISLSMQTIWCEKDYTYFAKDSKYPLYLIENGINRHQLTPKEKKDYKRDTETGEIRENKPPLFLFNLRLTKEIGDNCKVMISMNNLFFRNPIYKSKRYENTFYTRNPEVYYGFKLIYKF